MTEKVQIAVVGLGRIGKMHTENLCHHIPSAHVKAIVDTQIDRQWAEGLDIPHITADFASVLADPDIQAIVIATSSTAHVELVQQAAKAGKSIFCEKPIAFEPEQIQAAMDVVEAAGAIFQVGFNRRFDPEFLALKNAVDAGKIGQAQIVKITNRDPKRADHRFIQRSGGIFLDFNVHDFDFARFVTDSEIAEVYATGAVLIDPALKDLGDLDTSIITLRMQNGCLCVIDASRETHYGYDQRVEVFGSKGSLQSHHLTATQTRLINTEGIHSEKPLYSFVERYQQAFINELTAFIDCVRDNCQASVTGYDAKQAVRAAVLAQQSFQENRLIVQSPSLRGA